MGVSSSVLWKEAMAPPWATLCAAYLLASLPGAAITSIRVTDVPHEFSAIEHVREDMMQFILHIKQLRLKLHNTDTARLRLEVHGAGTVTAADIQYAARS
jgi:DNA-directed RNA polymerase subunit alpha